MAAHQRLDAGDVLVEDERQGGFSPDRQAMLVGAARLLDVDVTIANGIDDTQRIIDPPARVRIGDEHFPFGQHISGRVYALDIVCRIAPDLELELGVAVRAMPGNILCHLTRRPLADCTIESDTFPEPAA